MRGIKFRGKSNQDGFWVYGNYVNECVGIGCMSDGSFDITLVEPDTVCQYTCLFDKYKTPIYEGDIIGTLGIYHNATVPRVARYSVVYFCGVFMVEPVDPYSDPKQPLYVMCQDAKVLGNVFDDKNLLGPFCDIDPFSI